MTTPSEVPTTGTAEASSGPGDALEEPALPPAPWLRFSWLLATPWLAFLAFPVAGILQSPLTGLAAAIPLTAIVAFAGLYVYAFIVNARTLGQDGHAAVLLGILGVLTVPVFVAVGVDAFGMFTFLATYAIFSQPLRRAVQFVAVLLLAMAVVLISTDHLDRWFYLMITAGTAAFVGMIRWIDGRQQQRDELENQLVLTAERERVARDVHDVLGHSLTVVTVKAELAERLVDADPEAAKAEIAAIRSLTREALGEVRATVSGLRVARLADELESARAALIDAGITAVVPADPAVVDPRHRIVLAWVLREAVTNVVRHARATRCEVTLASASMQVIDDGVGPGAATESGGLRGARERVRAAGGTLTVSPGEAGGTRVEVHW
ncbi:sensor histidine kinase [Ruania suaedae]|uniref:sensor histidine kinase n=1 Tax=Ruania suaedae TaxID=2897774 RepID=UPI001E39E508|nr:sensor histidine kinase [Ruania suaedae]UFU02970.1 sensor histidine kinase [Ruania suaedae]